jgi:hypothetical protein
VFTVQQRNRVRIAIAFGFDRFLWRHKHYLPHCPGDTGRWAAHRVPSAFIVGGYPFFIQTDSESGHRKNLARPENDRLRSWPSR